METGLNSLPYSHGLIHSQTVGSIWTAQIWQYVYLYNTNHDYYRRQFIAVIVLQAGLTCRVRTVNRRQIITDYTMNYCTSVLLCSSPALNCGMRGLSALRRYGLACLRITDKTRKSGKRM